MLESDAYVRALMEFKALSASEQQLSEELLRVRARTAHLVQLLLPVDASDEVINDVLCGPARDVAAR